MRDINKRRNNRMKETGEQKMIRNIQVFICANTSKTEKEIIEDIRRELHDVSFDISGINVKFV